MWCGLAGGTSMGHAKMAHQHAGVRWPTDGFHNPFLSVFGNRSSVVKLSVQRRGVVQESQHAWLQATNGKRALESSTQFDANFTRPHPIRIFAAHRLVRATRRCDGHNRLVEATAYSSSRPAPRPRTCREMPRLITPRRLRVTLNARARHASPHRQSSIL